MAARRNILFVHQNFPGQFPHVAQALARRGDRVAAIGSATARNIPGIDMRRWTNPRSSAPGILPHAVRAEADLIRGRAAAGTAMALRNDGFVPDVIVGHPGWGETIHMKEIFPEARMILFGEYYYKARGGDADFDAEFADRTLDARLRLTALNATQLLSYVQADRIICPTPFQAATFPEVLQGRITVLHEGIDVAAAARRPGARLTLPGGRVIDGSRPVVTYVSRTLEPLRGFHVFMRALPRLFAQLPELDVLVIGDPDRVGYGRRPAGQPSWQATLLAELGEGIDPARLHFLGRVQHGEMIQALSLSWAHAYLTYPFVLSWSLLEAMACGCLIVASDTAPVRDVIRDGENGLLVDFFDVERWSATLHRAIEDQRNLAGLREQARAAAQGYDSRSVGVPGWLRLIDSV